MNLSNNLSETARTVAKNGSNETSYFLGYYYDYYMYVYDMALMQMYVNFVNFVPHALITMVCLSVLGNVTTMVVVLQRKNRKHSISVYIASLALADLLLNCGSTFNNWLIQEGHALESYSTLDCKLRLFIPYASQFASPWTLSAIAVERAMSVTAPHKMKSLCSIQITYVVVVAIWTFSFFVSGVMCAIRYQIVFDYGRVRCTIIPEAMPFYTKYFTFFYSFVMFVIPIIVVATCTVIIIYKLTMRPNTMANENKQKVRSSVTIALVKVNIVFILLSGPHCIFYLLDAVGFFQNYTTIDNIIEKTLTKSVLIFLIDLNSVLNFFVYFLSGSKFRKDLHDLIKCKRKSLTATTATPLGQENNTTLNERN